MLSVHDVGLWYVVVMAVVTAPPDQLHGFRICRRPFVVEECTEITACAVGAVRNTDMQWTYPVNKNPLNIFLCSNKESFSSPR